MLYVYVCVKNSIYLKLIVHLLTMNNLLVLGKEIYFSVVDAIYLQVSLNSIYICLDQRIEASVQLIFIMTNHVRY